ncbi:MAG: glutamate-1-semialdehyde 2,1-aminomutase [Hydrogenobaculum sp.]
MTNKEAFELAKRYMPGGVSSPVRAFKSVGAEPIVVNRGFGAFIEDIEGKRYIDYMLSFGPLILGHRSDIVVSKIMEALDRGNSFGITNLYEIELSELIVKASKVIDKVRFVSSGTEAVMSAIRLARGITNKPYIIKFDGCYHGFSDSVLVGAGSGVATLGIPGTPGIPKEFAAFTIVLDYNDEEALEEAFSKYKNQIAAVLVEPVAGNMGVVLPKESWLRKLRTITKENDALLIFDEVITGFRLALGGAAEYFGIEPDIVCYGKIIGGGMPIGAYGAKNHIMEKVAPEGPIYQAGTLSGNPISVASGLAILKTLIKDITIYDRLAELRAYFTYAISKMLLEKGIAHKINEIASMFTIFFTDKDVVDFKSAKTSDTNIFGKFFRNALQEGVLMPPSQFEAWFLSTAHTKDVIDITLEKLKKAIDLL